MPGRKYWFKKGDRFGRYTVINETPIKSKRECKCTCGAIKRVNGSMLASGRTKSCGCYQREMLSKHPRGIKNGIRQKSIRFPNIYRKMKGRCEDPRYTAYPLYGGRGIKCEWQTLEDFYNDMRPSYKIHIEEYGEKDTTLDRIDVNGNYCKDNCRWATWREQGNNKRNNLSIEIGGKTYGTLEFAKKYNLTQDTARDRITRYLKGNMSYESLIHYGPITAEGIVIKGKFYTYNELGDILGADRNWLWKRIMKYKNGEISGEEMLLTKEEVKDPTKRKGAVVINGTLYDAKTLSKKVGINKASAGRRIRLYKEGKMPDYIVLHKGKLPTKRKTLVKN